MCRSARKIGSLTPGKQADLILIRTDDINLYPSGNAFGTVVHATERSNIDTVMIGGRIVKREGKVLGVDSEQLRAAIDESRQHLFVAAGYTQIFLPRRFYLWNKLSKREQTICL